MYEELDNIQYSINELSEKMDDIKDISEKLGHIEELLSLCLVEMRKANAGTAKGFNGFNLCDVESLINKNLLLVSSSKDVAMEFGRKIAKEANQESHVIHTGDFMELVRTLTATYENEYILIDIDNLLISEKNLRVITDAIRDCSIEMELGIGTGSGPAELQLYHLNYIVISEREEYVPKTLLDLLTIVK